MGKAQREPPCPGDRDKYTLVRTRRGMYWRLKRGTNKPVKLNASFQKNSDNMAIANNTATAILKPLKPFIDDLDTWRLHADIAGIFLKERYESDSNSIGVMEGVDLQPIYPIEKVLQNNFQARIDGEKREAVIKIKMFKDWSAVVVKNRFFSGYRFKGILIIGDFNSMKLQTIVSESPLFFENEEDEFCELRIAFPKGTAQYMLCLRVESYESDRSIAVSSKTRGCKVLKSGVVD